MQHSMRFICLVAAALAFLTFTFLPAGAQVDPRDRTKDQDLVRPLRVQGADPGKPASGPLAQKQDQPKAEQPKPGDKQESTKFVQIKKDQDGKPLALQTAIARYVPANKADKEKEGLVIDLVSVVHIADRKYFDKLNTRFEDYDVVLFELVMAKGTKVPKGGPKGSSNPLAMIQQLMTVVLQLEHQTKCIDYTAKNFVHADLSPQELSESIKKNGDNSLTLILKIAADIIAEQNKMAAKPGANPGGDFDPLKLFTDPMATSKLKVMMAEQMALVSDGAGLGKTLNKLLIDERNTACMKVLNEQIAAGKKKIAIFYGAAHMPDFERRLIDNLGMQRSNVIWYDAWDLTPKAANPLDLFKLLNP